MTAPFRSEDWIRPDGNGGVIIGTADPVPAEHVTRVIHWILAAAGRGLRPVPMCKADLLAVLDDIRAGIEADDSFDGNLEYQAADEPGFDFGVTAVYRTGSSKGQGSVRMIGGLR